jgi:carbonic anhydrase/acetyltransferase-like protein (isoleucine patch superfamily)
MKFMATSAPDRIAKAWMDPKEHIAPMIGSEGYALPDITSHTWHRIGDPAMDNWLVGPPETNPAIFSTEFSGKSNVIIYGSGSTMHGRIGMMTDEATVIIGDRSGQGSDGYLNIHGFGRAGVFFFGAKSSANQATFFVQSDRSRLIVGEDCMFAHAITCRTNDDHSIIDMESGAFLNPAADIHIEPHVWVCPDATILRGVTIGFGSVVGMKSSVTRSIPPFTLAGGQPARILRKNISWDRSSIPSPDLKDNLSAWFKRLPNRL